MMWKSNENIPKSAIGALNECPAHAFPIINKMILILATLPISTAEAERQFSKVKRTLTALRATMIEEMLEGLIMIETYRGDLPSTEDIIDRFRLSKRRMEF